MRQGYWLPIKMSGSERGATMIEFSLVALLLFALTGSIIDLGFGIYSYQRLTSTVATVTRQIAADGMNCPDRERARQKLEQRLQELFHQSSTVPLPEIQSLNPSTSMRTLTMTGKIPLNCFFCFVLPEHIMLSATTVEVIERTDCP